MGFSSIVKGLQQLDGGALAIVWMGSGRGTNGLQLHNTEGLLSKNAEGALVRGRMGSSHCVDGLRPWNQWAQVGEHRGALAAGQMGSCHGTVGLWPQSRGAPAAELMGFGCGAEGL